MSIHFRQLRASDDEEKFYAKMGKFFASRQVRKSLGGYPLDNELDWIWIVAIEKRSFSIVGFISIDTTSKQHLVIRSLYTTQEHQEVARPLLDKAVHLSKYEVKALESMVMESQVELFTQAGFEVKSTRGKWKRMWLSNE